MDIALQDSATEGKADSLMCCMELILFIRGLLNKWKNGVDFSVIVYKCYHSVEFIRCQSNGQFSYSVSMDSIIASDVISHTLSQVTL